jgi:L-arabinokinase
MDATPEILKGNNPMKVEQIFGPDIKPYEVLEFESMLRYEDFQMFGEYGFEKNGQVIITRAPARLDVMGGIASHWGANGFGLTLERSAVVGCQARQDSQLSVLSFDAAAQGYQSALRISIDDLYAGRNLKAYEEVQSLFAHNPQTAWAGYVLGGFFALLMEGVVDHLPHGAAIVIRSNIPVEAGIGSSAAIKVAALTAINHLYALNLTALDIARIGGIVENRIVGALGSATDTIAVAAGQQDHLLSIHSQPDPILETVPLPPNTQLIGVHGRAQRRPSVAYIDALVAAFMGLTILRKTLDLEALRDNDLCRLSVEDFRQKCWGVLPARMKGEDFLDQYGELIDHRVKVDPQKVYAVRSRVEHPIYERPRAEHFIEHLKQANTDPQHLHYHLVEAGKLMYASDWSARFRAGLGSPQIEQIIRSIRKVGIRGGFYGAKITSSGSTVAILCHGDVSNAMIQIFSAYKLAWGLDAEVFAGSSSGAFEFGHVILRLSKE